MQKKHKLLTLLLAGLLSVSAFGCSMQADDGSSDSKTTEADDADGAKDGKSDDWQVS